MNMDIYDVNKNEHIYGPDHDNLVLIAYAQTPHKRQHGDISSEARGINFES